MIYTATTISGEKVDLGTAYSTQINKSQTTPADSLTAAFFSKKNQPELKLIDVYSDNGQVFFSGIVDEQKFEINENGCFFTIKSRSKAAYLIDNEASPQTYNRPSLDIIFRRHIKPYGFVSVSGNKSSFNKTINVEAGMSEWDVLEKFCNLCLKTFPTVKNDGTIDASGKISSEIITFSNTNGSTKYTSISQKYSRYKLISEITVCAPYAAIYVGKVKDQELIDNGISRRKFLSMTDDPYNPEPISVETAEFMISDAKKKYKKIIIKCPGANYAEISQKCEINDIVLGNINNLIVYEIEYLLNKNGETTVFTLLEA